MYRGATGIHYLVLRCSYTKINIRMTATDSKFVKDENCPCCCFGVSCFEAYVLDVEDTADVDFQCAGVSGNRL